MALSCWWDAVGVDVGERALMAEPRLSGRLSSLLLFFCAGSRIVVGMHGLLSHRMAPSCFDIELTTAFDWWSKSDSTAVLTCVRLAVALLWLCRRCWRDDCRIGRSVESSHGMVMMVM